LLIRASTVLMWAALALLASLRPSFADAQSLKVHLNGDQLHVDAPDLRFLSEAALARLHDGATVIYRFRVTVSATKTGKATSEYTYHCVFSFDILEEKFKVSRQEPGYRSASHLSESAARDLCLDSLTIPVMNVSTNQAFWVSIEYQMEDRQASADRAAPRSVLDTLVTIFGQKNKSTPPPVDMLRGGPFRMEDLRKNR
jgi:hypothetical protein